MNKHIYERCTFRHFKSVEKCSSVCVLHQEFWLVILKLILIVYRTSVVKHLFNIIWNTFCEFYY